MMKRTYFFGVSFRRSCRFSKNHSTSASLALVVGIDLDYCDMNGLLWNQTEIILSFLKLHPSTAFQTLLLTMMTAPFILRDSSPTVVDIMVI